MDKNAIILSAGTSSRFVPLSLEIPKGLLEVKGEILIERQIRQLIEAGITDICIVVGYMAKHFSYLRKKFGVSIEYNEDFARYNNTSSMIRVLDRLDETYILTSDNYYQSNPFIHDNTEKSYYSALFSHDYTGEYCLHTDTLGEINSVTIGGANCWYMYGPAFFSREFSEKFVPLLCKEYSENQDVRLGYWEDLYIRHLDELKMTIRKRNPGEILEFDSLEELRAFDTTYIENTRSQVIKSIADSLGCKQGDLSKFCNLGKYGECRFSFVLNSKQSLIYDNGRIKNFES